MALVTGWARFDDLREPLSMGFAAPHQVLETADPDQVAPLLRAVDAATRQGSWAYGYVAYEASCGLDPSLPGGLRDGQHPLVWFGLCEPPASLPPLVANVVPDSTARTTWRPDWSDMEHADAVMAVRERIAQGETYQCNLTDRFRAVLDGDLQSFYRKLALAQRGAYNAFVDTGAQVVISASPELFFEWRGGTIRTRPMKGTAARGKTCAEDVAQSRRLRGSAKEQAENVMIVDLLRNDLGRIAVPGTVQVEELLRLERYPTVWQLTSEVAAEVPEATALLDVFRALFPCGSVTGAPKRRTMQIIQDLEPTPRGVYCGAVGYIAPPDAPTRARFSVAIRTAVVDKATGAAVYGAGGGITWDSKAAAEREEVYAKTAVLRYGSVPRPTRP